MSNYGGSSGNFSDPGNQQPGFSNQFTFGTPPNMGDLIKQFLAKKQQQGMSQQQAMSSLAQAIKQLQMNQMSGGTGNDFPDVGV